MKDGFFSSVLPSLGAISGAAAEPDACNSSEEQQHSEDRRVSTPTAKTHRLQERHVGDQEPSTAPRVPPDGAHARPLQEIQQALVDKGLSESGAERCLGRSIRGSAEQFQTDKNLSSHG